MTRVMEHRAHIWFISVSSIGSSIILLDLIGINAYLILLCFSQLGLPQWNTTDWVASTTEICVLTFLGTRKLRSRYQKIEFLVRPLFLACRQPLSCCVLFSVLRERERWGLFLSLNGYQPYRIRAPPLWPHLTLITSLIALSPNTVTWGWGEVRASTYKFWRDTIQPITSSLASICISLKYR